MANLSSLPGEVIDAICDYLRTPGIQNLRFVDKSLNVKASHAFFNRKFGTVQFMITRNSLKVLVERSKDSRFRTAVKELQLCLITFPPQSKRELDRNLSSSEQKELHEIETELISEGVAKLAFDLDARADATYDPLPPVHPRIAQFETRAKQKRRRLYSTIMHDQNTLRTKGLDVEMLAEALRNLPALTDITTVDRYQNLNPPFGAKAIFRQLKGIHPRPAAMFKPDHRNHYSYPWHVHQDEVRNIFRNYCMHSIGVVLGAILKSGCQLQGTLSLAGVPHELLFSKIPTRRRLYPTATPSKTFALSQIPELKLAKLTGLNLSMYGYPEEDIRLLGIQPEDYLRWLKQFIPLMPNLKSLSITGAYTRHERSLLRPLADGQQRIPNLQTLELKYQCFSMEHLQLVLLKHATTLRSLKLWECTTTAQTFVGLFQALSQLSHITFVDISYAKYQRWENLSMGTRLRGHGTAEFRIQAATPGEFQLELASMYTVFAGAKA